MSSTWGKNLKISIFGESHADSIGVTIDGIKAGESIDTDELLAFMKRRTSVDSTLSTPRKEQDVPNFLCGIKDGLTTGSPIGIVIKNADTISKDYSQMEVLCRPGHADFTGGIKYGGYNDIAGGGHFSGRLTAPLVAAGGICKQILEGMGMYTFAHIHSIKGICDTPFDAVDVGKFEYEQLKYKQFAVLDSEKGEQMKAAIRSARLATESVGGIIECAAIGLPVGVGTPMFDGLENRISGIVFGIPAVKGIEFGNGFDAASLFGSENNDEFYCDEGRTVKTRTNNHGGILGGISSGMPIILRVAIKPTSTIGKAQNTINMKTLENTQIIGKGRHDPCIVTRAVACVEAAVAIAILDEVMDYKKYSN